MEPLPSPDVDALFALADLGVRVGLGGHPEPLIYPATLPASLREPRGVFVTVEVAGQLNGCMGTIEAVEPLGVAVARLAWDAAFVDPRLPPLTAEEYPSLEIKLSLIGPLEPLPAPSEEGLAAGLRPGIDGLVIRCGRAQATFLPAVWKKLPDPITFLRHLEAKAGLEPGLWPAGMRAWRYSSTEYCRRAVDINRHSWSAA